MLSASRDAVGEIAPVRNGGVASYFLQSREATIKHFGVVLLGVLALLPATAQAQPAPDTNSVLVLTSVDSGGVYSTAAAAQGFTVVPASDAAWAVRTTAEFATFKAIIIGDPSCGGTPPAAAVANAATWSAAVTGGPILIIGTDEALHSQGAQLRSSGIAFAASAAGRTGAYISTSCYYSSAAVNTPVPLLASLGTFLAGAAGGCFDNAHIVATHPALVGLTDAGLSNWGCSVHNVWNSFPSASFVPLAIARNVTGPGALTFGDGSNGIPYILASGSGIVVAGTSAQPVPALSPWMLGALALMLAGAGFFVKRRFPS